jgi:hypothetical protein
MRKGSLGTLHAQGSLQVDSESKGIQKAQGVPILAEVNLYCIILVASHGLTHHFGMLFPGAACAENCRDDRS